MALLAPTPIAIVRIVTRVNRGERLSRRRICWKCCRSIAMKDSYACAAGGVPVFLSSFPETALSKAVASGSVETGKQLLRGPRQACGGVGERELEHRMKEF